MAPTWFLQTSFLQKLQAVAMQQVCAREASSVSTGSKAPTPGAATYAKLARCMLPQQQMVVLWQALDLRSSF
jgi:hypothetical protein